MQINATQAWNLYLGIHTTVTQHVAQNGGHNHDLKCALQRLCQAIFIKYDIRRAGYPVFVYNNQNLNVNAIGQLNLNTTRAMVNAKVVEWREAHYESRYVGTDDDSPASQENDYADFLVPAAFTPQKSIQDCLDKKEFFEIRASFNANAEVALSLYQRIDECARFQLNRISHYRITFKKDWEIDFALQRLLQAILIKYNQPAPEGAQFTVAIDPNRVQSLELYSMKTMLDARIFDLEGNQRRSLRQVLNISRINPINIIWYQQAYWGKSTALQQFEWAMSADTELQALIN